MARTALVTGGNRGIGQQVARVLASDGWDVLIGTAALNALTRLLANERANAERGARR